MAVRSISIVGLGPAGAGAAAAASKLGVKPVVYEAMEKPGLKPCGRGLPVVDDGLPVRIPRDSILRRIRGARMYVDGEFLFEMREFLEGYIVDKTVMLEAIAVESDAEIYYRAKYKPGSSRVKLPGGGEARVEKGVFAGGHPYYGGLKITAVQWIMETGSRSDPVGDMLEIHFDTSLLGYAYVFPKEEGFIEVGIGGFATAGELRSRLERFISSRSDLRGLKRVKLEGARIAIGGLDLGLVDGMVKAGEAAGFVLPLTGEGIRPSLISGYEAAASLIEGGRPLERLRATPIARAVSMQKRILDLVAEMKVEERRRLLKSLTPRAHAEIALGMFRKHVLLRELARSPGALKLLGLATRLI
ncbi:dehydrogenase [Aeropyrum camini SY1 = JCM 12091]|uniref:Dehydrogenase n=1 Tax=Aeropyrum camini SY1 = JCM 12091 TaxID=1198449 RepID=U3TF88_9CREN|nr:dehydrogenase [Aeropyrum camini SY1 = JCM 12091]